MDFVKCNECGFVGYIEQYSDECSACKSTHALQDMDEGKFLFNDDCLNILKNIQDKSIDMVFTDPPYGVKYQNNYTLNKHKKIANDDTIDYLTFGKECYRVLKDNSHAYFFTRFDVYPEHATQLREAGFTIKNVLVIEKGHIGGVGDLKGSYANNSEWVIFCQKGRREFNKTTLMKNSKPVGKKCARQGNPIQEYKTRFNSCWFGEEFPKCTYNSSWQKKTNILHPTVKNVEFIKWILQISSNDGDVVLDPFMGSGSTGIACEETNRKFVGIELDNTYFDLYSKWKTIVKQGFLITK